MAMQDKPPLNYEETLQVAEKTVIHHNGRYAELHRKVRRGYNVEA